MDAENNKVVVLSQTKLAPRQKRIIGEATPKIFIREKPGRGGKKMSYVEGGYVIAKLNEAFSPLGWEFKVAEKGTTDRKNESNAEGEVWVYGELSVVDHKNGYRVTKGQYGQHPIHKNVPIGDAYKAAATDSLKKCASYLGIALDVYWQETSDVQRAALANKPGNNKSFGTPAKAPDAGKTDMEKSAMSFIMQCTTLATLDACTKRVTESKDFSEAKKIVLLKVIEQRRKTLEKK